MEQRTERLEQSIERLGEAVVSSRNVDWKTIIATCSLVFMLVVTIGGTLTAWTTTQVGSVDDQVRRNADELRERAADIYAVGEVKSRLSLLYDSVKGLEAHMGDRWTRSDHDEKTVPALESLRRDLHELEVRFAAGGVPR